MFILPQCVFMLPQYTVIFLALKEALRKITVYCFVIGKRREMRKTAASPRQKLPSVRVIDYTDEESFCCFCAVLSYGAAIL